MNSDLFISSSIIVSIRFLYCCSVILIVTDFFLFFFISSIISSLVILGVLVSVSYLVFSFSSRRVSLLKIGGAIESPYPFKGSITPGFFCFDLVPRRHRKTWFVGYFRGIGSPEITPSNLVLVFVLLISSHSRT